ncbi:MAG: PQQ-dependent catabolism-associated CXXCW motif protein [Thermohalobaculum sp.]|nr:PQQ-dependent catabolism-associated CXXCW motif protein [Thermohalobaculum sp.]
MIRVHVLRLAALALLAAGLAAGPAGAGETVPEPDGYRQAEFRAPVPATLAGATVLDDAAAFALWQEGKAAFVDVLPRPPKPDNLPAGTIWREKVRMSIPGATWLPNVGFGELAPQTDAYFRDGLARLSGGAADHPLVFFCLTDCWMSWNAARRALGEYGYTRVMWYPQGTDGWAAASHPLEQVEPSAP